MKQQQAPIYIEIDEDGNKHYYSDREMTVRHRADGPAIECYDGAKAWWQNGRLHRLDGPAIEWPDGRKSWYIDSKYLTEAEFLAATTVHELTLDEIASRLGIDVENLKIVK